MEAVFGKETEIEIPKEETCDTCDGSGAKKGTHLKHVHIVMVQVKLTLHKTHHLDEWSIVRACHHCQGTGKLFLKNVQLVMVQVL